jgi:hypothetical protein
MGWFSSKAEEVKDSVKFATEKPSSKDFGKNKQDWKASKDADKKGK